MHLNIKFYDFSQLEFPHILVIIKQYSYLHACNANSSTGVLVLVLEDYFNKSSKKLELQLC